MVATFIVVFSDAFGISLVDTPMVGVGEAGTKLLKKNMVIVGSWKSKCEWSTLGLLIHVATKNYIDIYWF